LVLFCTQFILTPIVCTHLATVLILPPFLFLLIPRQPTSTLFPYTTLFRSDRGRKRAAVVRRDDTVALAPHHERRDRNLGESDRIDRKSTRLNSSHQIISYAVFCLKTKKKTINITSVETRNAARRIQTNHKP